MKDLADRMKNNYENRQRFYLTRRMPVIIRADGRCFHNVTRCMKKPFDETFIANMKRATLATARDIQGCKLAFTQSDEASFLLTDYDNLQSEGWFDYNLAKMVSIAAANMSVTFSEFSPVKRIKQPIVFDARAFNLPREEVVNYFLSRAKDWERNSLLMYAQSFFSHSQMQNKSCADLHEMLHEIEKNWTTDLPNHLKNGNWLIVKDDCWLDDILPNYESINKWVEELINPPEAN